MRDLNGKDLVLKKRTLQKIDPFQESVDSLVVVAFPKSSSKNFPLALSIAESASRYGAVELGGKVLHVAVFLKSVADAGRARMLLSYVDKWKGTLVFQGGGVLYGSFAVMEILSCYAQASLCSDMAAHCYTVIDDPFVKIPSSSGFGIRIPLDLTPKSPPLKRLVEVDRYLFPCRRLSGYFRFETDHPSSAIDQIQAEAVQRGCVCCPNFSADNFRKIGIRNVEVNVFD